MLRRGRGTSRMVPGVGWRLAGVTVGSVAVLMSAAAPTLAAGQGSGRAGLRQACADFQGSLTSATPAGAAGLLADAMHAAAGDRPLAGAFRTLSGMPETGLSAGQWAAATRAAATITSACRAAGMTGVRAGSLAAPKPLTANTQYAWTWFASHTTLTAVQIAGLEGNLMEESSVVPTATQTGCSTCGYGIAQWTIGGGRYNALKNLAASEGKPISDLTVQLEFVWQELTGSYAGAGRDLGKQTTIQGATDTVMNEYEIPNPVYAHEDVRLASAQAALNAYAGSPPPAAAKDVVGVVTTGGEAFVKAGGLGAQWVDEHDSVTQLAVASDPTNGVVIVVLTSNGNVYAKAGGLGAQWTLETTGATKIAVATDPVHGPLIAVVDKSGNVSAKEGSLSAGWVLERNQTAGVAVASDPTHGPLIVTRATKTGNIYAKEGSLSAGWVLERGGNSTSFAAASDSKNGPLIVVRAASGSVYAKEGSLGATWTLEMTQVATVAAASDPQNGPLLAVRASNGNMWVKEGSLGATWTLESNQATAMSVASDPVNGPLLGVHTTDGNVSAKEGSLGATWTLEMNQTSAVAVAG